MRLRQIIAGVPTTYTQDPSAGSGQALAALLPVVLQSKTGTDAMQYVYALGTRPLAQNGGAWEYLIPDALGSVRQIVDANGNVTLAESYEPHGTVLTSTGTASSIFGYAGEQADTTGLIYLRARYMNPRLGIFLARDPWSGEAMQPGSMNGWGYVEGNPISRVDPSGRFSVVRLANSSGFAPDLSGVTRWFESLSDHWGWALLLLDAESGDDFYNFAGLTTDVKPGIFDCKGGVISPLTRPSLASSIWWRDNGAYGLRKMFEGYSHLYTYLDKGDSGNISDFPDFMIYGGSAAVVGGGFIFDRYGNAYGNGSLGRGPAAYGYYGEGYVSQGNIFGGYHILTSEDDLKTGIEGVSLSLSGALVIGAQININFCPSDVFGLFGTCYTGLVYTIGIGGELGIGGSGTLPLPLLNRVLC